MKDFLTVRFCIGEELSGLRNASVSTLVSPSRPTRTCGKSSLERLVEPPQVYQESGGLCNEVGAQRY